MGVNWVNLVQEWKKWRAFVTMVMDFRVQKMGRERSFLTT
jgi:hypothetical protein